MTYPTVSNMTAHAAALEAELLALTADPAHDVDDADELDWRIGKARECLEMMMQAATDDDAYAIARDAGYPWVARP